MGSSRQRKGGLSPDLTIKRDYYARQIREFNEKKAKDNKKDTVERKERVKEDLQFKLHHHHQ